MNNMLSGLSFITSLLTPSKQQKQSPAVINAARNLAVVKCGGQLFHQPNDLVTSASAFSSPSASKNSSDDDDSRWTLLFKDSQLSIKPSSMRFHYELVCCKVVEDGEEDEDDDDDELSFLLHPDLLFRSNSLSPQFLAYLWTDSAGTHYKWVPTPVNQDNVEEALDDFTYFAHKCMFEALAKTESDNVSLEELNRIAESIQAQAAAIAAETSASLRSRYTSSSSTPVKVTPSAASLYPSLLPVDEVKTPVNNLVDKFKQVAITPSSTSSSSSKLATTPSAKISPSSPPHPPTTTTTTTSTTSATPSENLASHIPEGSLVHQTMASLALFDFELQSFNAAYDIVTVSIVKGNTINDSGFWLLIKDKQGEAVLCQTITPSMQPTLRQTDRVFAWVWLDEETSCPTYGWQAHFQDVASFDLFKQEFTQCMYDSLHGGNSFAKMKTDEQKYAQDAYVEDVDMMDVEEEEDDEEEDGEEDVASESCIRQDRGKDEKQDREDEDDDDAYGKAQLQEDRHAKNSSLIVGLQHDRSFVVRGNKIGVFKHSDQDGLKFSAAINNIRTLDDKTFSPRKLMLHQQDSSLLMTNGQDDKKIFRMDLETGQVVEEWKVDDCVPVEELIPDQKYAQRTQTQTIIGLNHNSIFKIDPRLAGNKRVDSQSKQYVTKNKFSCGATTGKGELVVGSSKGELRLFNKLNVRAKTLLPGLGDPIIGVDTTENGKWIVGTCKNYLLLIDTEIKGESGSLGFQKSMSEASKPVPKRLQLKPEHVAWMRFPVSFTPARFNTGEGTEEKTIITSTGPYVITWNFRRVKQGRLYDYQIKKYTDTVVADNFKYNEDRSIIVALPTNVEMISKSHLSTPTKLLKSRSDIVNSPY